MSLRHPRPAGASPLYHDPQLGFVGAPLARWGRG